MNKEAIQESINALEVISDALLTIIELEPITDTRGLEFMKSITNALYIVTLEVDDYRELLYLHD
jgi:hypothetical protein